VDSVVWLCISQATTGKGLVQEDFDERTTDLVNNRFDVGILTCHVFLNGGFGPEPAGRSWRDEEPLRTPPRSTSGKAILVLA
jgi:hypothetical protein